jgi:hypothetical protein
LERGARSGDLAEAGARAVELAAELARVREALESRDG